MHLNHSPNAPKKNLLLNMLPDEDLQRFMSSCEQVELSLGNNLYQTGDSIHYAYFPTSGFISLMIPVEGHGDLEVALIGNEGMYGISLMLGVNTTLLNGVVQGSGLAWRMTTEHFYKELKRNLTFQQQLNRYVYVLIMQLAQTAACNRYHVVEARLARWLLMTRDHACSDEFYITHEFLAHMLGVRRVGVTKAAGALQQQKLISYSRGNIKINNVAGLEKASCSCYLRDKEVYRSILHI